MNEEIAFEDFPFRKLEINVHRRELLHSMWRQFKGTTSKLGDKPTYRIEDLGVLPIKDLESIVPALYPGCEFKTTGDVIYGQAPRRLAFIPLFKRGSAAHRLFELFNENRTISRLSLSLRKRCSMDEHTSLMFSRGLFLFLAEEGFAYPKAGVPDHA